MDSAVVERRVAFGVVAAAAVAGCAMRAVLAFGDQGIYWPDEIYRTIEMGHRVAFGYGMRPWEFVQGAASWIYPAFLALILRASSVVGITGPAGYINAVRVVFVLMSIATAFCVWWLARSFGARPIAAAGGTAAFLLAAPAIYFAHRTLSETGSTLPVVAGLALTLPPRRSVRALIAGGALLGVASLFRPQNMLFAAVVVVALACRRSWRPPAVVAGVVVVAVLIGGFVDLVTWGSWFHSTRLYLQFNLIEGRAADWGIAPRTYYIGFLWRSLGPLLASAFGAFSLAAVRRAPGLAAAIVVFIGAHAMVPHKESRFIVAALAPLCALAAIGITEIASRAKAQPRGAAIAWTATAVVLVGAVVSATWFHAMTWREIGGAESLGSTKLAYDYAGDFNRLLVIAHDQQDLCGVLYEHFPQFDSGGYTYLHRRVAILSGPPYNRSTGAANYAITERPAGATVIARRGRWSLVRFASRCPTPKAPTDTT